MEEINTTSSVGAVWPPEQSSFGRVRGFYDQGVISTSNDVE